MDEISRELRRGTLSLAVLSLLEQQDLYGYEIAARLAAQSDGALDLAEGTLYPLLRRLAAQNLVETYWVETIAGVPPRRYYRMTPAGRQELARQRAEWLRFTEIMRRFVRGDADA